MQSIAPGTPESMLPYSMDCLPLDNTPLERDMRVQIDAELKFREQAASAVAKARQVLAVIRHSFTLLDDATLPLLSKTLV